MATTNGTRRMEGHVSRAIVVGSINMDVVTFVKHHPLVGETVFGKDLKYFPGGKGANQAVSCNRLGCQTLMVGQVGGDEFGKKMISFMDSEGIDTSEVHTTNETPTGTAFITVNENSENSIIVISGANSSISCKVLEAVQIKKNDVVISQFEIPDEVISTTFQKAKDAGAITILNPAPVRECRDTIIKNCDIIILNEVELQFFAGIGVNIDDEDSIFDAAKRITDLGPSEVVITLGHRGVRLFGKHGRKRINARSVSAVDTTGAGDCFIGGLVAGILSGLTIEGAAELGNLAASISVTREGAASSIPTLKEVNDIYGSDYV